MRNYNGDWMTMYVFDLLTNNLAKPKVFCEVNYYANQLSLLRDLVDLEE